MPPSQFIPGSHWKICDRSGVRVRSYDTRKEWNGLIVRKRSYEARHPQDFVKGVKDDQTVPDPRLRQTASFLGPLTTTLTAAAAAGSTTLPVSSSTRFADGDHILLVLSNGDQLQAIVQDVPDSTNLVVTVALPLSADNGALITNLSAVSEASID